MHWTRQVGRTRTASFDRFCCLEPVAGMQDIEKGAGLLPSHVMPRPVVGVTSFAQGSDTSSIGKKSDASSMNWCSPQLKLPHRMYGGLSPTV